MASITSNQRGRELVWRVSGLWMVVVALGLALTGVFLALGQARSLTYRLTAQAESHAGLVAERAREQFDQQLADALRAVAEHVRAGAGPVAESPGGLPGWLDGLFTWNGRAMEIVAQPSGDNGELIGLAEARLAAWPLQPAEQTGRLALDTLPTPPRPPLARGGWGGRPRGESRASPELLYDTLGHTQVVLACIRSTDSKGEPIAIAGCVNLPRLKSDLVEPLLPADAGLELVPAGVEYKPWSQPLHGAMRFWSVKPTEAFVHEQQRAVVGHTLVYLGLTTLALATLLGAMWVLIRAVRREMALADLKANFVADVSHELKTPLALIRLFGETLHSGRVTSEEKRREYYAIITRESTRLSNLINNILDFARIEAGRNEYAMEPTDIADVVRDTYEAYRAQLEHNGFEHHLTVDTSLPRVEADRDAIAQALINLINNAIKYSGEARSVAIDVTSDTRRGRQGVLISVHDRGIGIRPEDRARLSDGFFRASDDGVRERGGTGLGLALVKHIVEAHHGSLDVESRLVKGSTFRIFLPASERQ